MKLRNLNAIFKIKHKATNKYVGSGGYLEGQEKFNLISFYYRDEAIKFIENMLGGVVNEDYIVVQHFVIPLLGTGGSIHESDVIDPHAIFIWFKQKIKLLRNIIK